MWSYEKRLQYPVNIKETNAGLASAIMAQFGGPNRLAILSLPFFCQKGNQTTFSN